MSKYVYYLTIVTLISNLLRISLGEYSSNISEDNYFSVLFYAEARTEEAYLIEVDIDKKHMNVYKGIRNTTDSFLDGKLPHANKKLFRCILKEDEVSFSDDELSDIMNLYSNINYNVKRSLLRDGWGILFSTNGISYKFGSGLPECKDVDKLISYLFEKSHISITLDAAWSG
jgi:hypothetical protein